MVYGLLQKKSCLGKGKIEEGGKKKFPFISLIFPFLPHNQNFYEPLQGTDCLVILFFFPLFQCPEKFRYLFH